MTNEPCDVLHLVNRGLLGPCKNSHSCRLREQGLRYQCDYCGKATDTSGKSWSNRHYDGQNCGVRLCPECDQYAPMDFTHQMFFGPTGTM